MQVMVINDDPEVQIRVAKGLMAKGFQVVGMETVGRACAYVKLDPVDILITGERVGGRLSHTVALAAECANPMVTTMLLTDRNDPEIEELYDLLPSLYALISPKSDPAVVARLALSAVASPEDAERRMSRNAEARQMQPMADWAAVFQEYPTPASKDRTEEPEAADAFADDFEDIASWGDEEEIYALAEAIDAPEPHPASHPVTGGFATAFADLIREESASEAPVGHEPKTAPIRPPVLADAVGQAPAPAPANPLFAPSGAIAVNREAQPRATRTLPAQVRLPEVVPARQNRSDWIAAKLRELEGSEAKAQTRLHLA